MRRPDSTDIEILIAYETVNTELAATRLVLGTARAGRVQESETAALVPEHLLRLRTMVLPTTGLETY